MIKLSRLKKEVIRSFPLTKKISRRFRYYRRYFFELMNSKRYSKPAAFGMDNKLEDYLPDSGFFIEAGAHDGFFESNTYYLEKFKGWSGVLIEPIPELYHQCVKQRSKAKVFNCALVSSDDPKSELKMISADTMSFVKSQGEKQDKRTELVKTWLKPKEITVPARTLTSILDELKVAKVNFLSLDVEGYEMNVLKGLDFKKYRPDYILMEFFLEETKKEEVETFISDYYVFCIQLSPRDYLYKCVNVL
jgi:FkbM family methyltransferase